MKKIFVIGGMGCGKSTAVGALADQGLPVIDLDKVGHDVLAMETVKQDLVEAFGAEIFDEHGEIIRAVLAQKAFVNETQTRRLNSISMPRIEESFADQLDALARDHDAAVIEFSAFRGKQDSLAHTADCIVAILTPLDMRIARAVAAGWDEADVRNRIAQQITDAERIEAADITFNNDGTQEELRQKVIAWWKEYSA
ncbi:MAG: dephospho-CoA kinase [Raoultibacter sp.]